MNNEGMCVGDFDSYLPSGREYGLRAAEIEVLQVNLGFRCNQACVHCHLDCSPERTEEMPRDIMESVRTAAASVRPRLVDITGGAPELHPHLRWFIAALRADGHEVQLRTNLTLLTAPGFTDLPRFFADNRVRLAASLPCYTEENVNAQRGHGVWEKSVEAIRRLNTEGYGLGTGLVLDLVYNPGGAFLPGSQADLEGDFRRELAEREGLRFDRLLAMANVPVGRFARRLQAEGKDGDYHRLLQASFNPSAVHGLMCRHQIEIGWDGALYDCDFNLALGRTVDHGAPNHLQDFDPAALAGRRVVTGSHCFACVAGTGSSCGGALT